MTMRRLGSSIDLARETVNALTLVVYMPSPSNRLEALPYRCPFDALAGPKPSRITADIALVRHRQDRSPPEVPPEPAQTAPTACRPTGNPPSPMVVGECHGGMAPLAMAFPRRIPPSLAREVAHRPCLGKYMWRFGKLFKKITK